MQQVYNETKETEHSPDRLTLPVSDQIALMCSRPNRGILIKGTAAKGKKCTLFFLLFAYFLFFRKWVNYLSKIETIIEIIGQGPCKKPQDFLCKLTCNLLLSWPLDRPALWPPGKTPPSGAGKSWRKYKKLKFMAKRYLERLMQIVRTNILIIANSLDQRKTCYIKSLLYM